MTKIQENKDTHNQEISSEAERQKQLLKESQQYFRQLGQQKREEAEAFQVEMEKRGLIEKKSSLNTKFVYGKDKQILLKLTMYRECERTGKYRITASRKGEIQAIDSFKPSDSVRRAKFVNSIEGLNEEEKDFALKALMELANRVLNGSRAVSLEKAKKQVNFAVLSDGRIIEQTTKGFAVFSPDSNSLEFSSLIEDNDCIYEPQQFQTDSRGETLIGLPSDIVEYYNDSILDAEIESFLYRHIDLSEKERKLVVQYIKLTYLTDKLEEIPYLRAVGEKGNGKSRFIYAVGMLCYRPLFVVSITAAVLFRIVQAYHPTLIIDEANLNVESDDTQAIMQILNAGYQRIGKVLRTEMGGTGIEPRLENFDPFGAKILASLKTFDSAAFESRCIRILMQKTTRNEIRFRLSKTLKFEAEALRNKLALWRFRNYNRDFEQELDAAENALKNENLEPRYVQIGTPLYALINNESLKRDFAAMLKMRGDVDTEERRESLDGQLVSAIHELLVESESDTNGFQVLRLKGECREGEQCRLLTVEAIANKLNKDKPEKDHLKKDLVGKCLRKLELERRKINVRNEDRGKSAVVFNAKRLGQLFKNYGLPTPDELSVNCPSYISSETTVASVANDNKLLEDFNLNRRHEEENETANDNGGSHDSPNEHNDLNRLARAATVSLDIQTGSILFPSKNEVNGAVGEIENSLNTNHIIQCPKCYTSCSNEDSHCPNCEEDLLNS